MDAIRSRPDLVSENAVLRHQVNVLRRRSKRPRLQFIDWIKLPRGRAPLVVVAGDRGGPAGDCTALASCRLPPVLAAPSSCTWRRVVLSTSPPRATPQASSAQQLRNAMMVKSVFGGLHVEPSEFHGENEPPGATCHMCQRPLSVPRAKTSSRPSALRATAGAEANPPPSEFHGENEPPAVACHMCQRALSVPRTKTSSRPSALTAWAIVGSL
jgi:hypothetical protein